MTDRLAVNQEIRATQVRLIDPEGKQLGIVPLAVAIDTARRVDLDLVEVAPQADPPVAKVMDYGKHVYGQQRAERDARRSRRGTGQKSIRLRPKIDDHDFETKARHARRFLEEGNSVRVQVVFRMRELRRPEMGARLLDRITETLADVSQVETRGSLEGRFQTLVLAPKASHASKTG